MAVYCHSAPHRITFPRIHHIMKHLGFLVLAVATVIAVAGFSEKCPTCGLGMIWTGDTKTEWGKMFYRYECPSDHAWWIKAPNQYSSPAPSSCAVKCPTCDLCTYWTGDTYTEWGSLWKVYKCPSGHKSVGKF